ncbi:hypothetical protein PCE1_002774 [Barthelona sp. PCE]
MTSSLNLWLQNKNNDKFASLPVTLYTDLGTLYTSVSALLSPMPDDPIKIFVGDMELPNMESFTVDDFYDMFINSANLLVVDAPAECLWCESNAIPEGTGLEDEDEGNLDDEDVIEVEYRTLDISINGIATRLNKVSSNTKLNDLRKAVALSQQTFEDYVELEIDGTLITEDDMETSVDEYLGPDFENHLIVFRTVDIYDDVEDETPVVYGSTIDPALVFGENTTIDEPEDDDTDLVSYYQNNAVSSSVTYGTSMTNAGTVDGCATGCATNTYSNLGGASKWKRLGESYSPWTTSKRNKTGLIGLTNQGATCYLNSLLQALYMTPEFREMLYITPSVPHESEEEEEEPEKRAVEGEEEEDSDSDYSDSEVEDNTDHSQDIIYQLQTLFGGLQYCDIPALGTTNLTKSFGWTDEESWVQHDVTELNRVLCDNLEEKQKKVDAEVKIGDIYRGTTQSMLRCCNCGYISKTEQHIYDLTLNVANCESIDEALQKNNDTEIMMEDNAYDCPECGSPQTSEKTTRLKSVPPVVCMVLARFDYDWQFDRRVKLTHNVEYPTYMQFDRYKETAPAERPINEIKPADIPIVIDEPISAEEELIAPWQTRIEKEEPEVDLKNPADVETKTMPGTAGDVHELYAVIVHSGTADFGHYYCYVKNFHNGLWYKFDDDTITAMPKDWWPSDEKINRKRQVSARFRVAGTSSNSWVTPYVLFYRRIDSKAISATGEFIEAYSNVIGDQEQVREAARPHPGDKVSHPLSGPQFKLPVYNLEFEPFTREPIPMALIPNRIRSTLVKIEKRRQRTYEWQLEEAKKYIVHVQRCVDSKPAFSVKVESHWTVQQLRDDIFAKITEEIKESYVEKMEFEKDPNVKAELESAMQKELDDLEIRIRVVIPRRNKTKRPTDLIPFETYAEGLNDAKIEKRKAVFVEQNNLPNYTFVDELEEVEKPLLICFKYFNHETQKLQQIGYANVQKSDSLGTARDLLFDTLFDKYAFDKSVLQTQDREEFVFVEQESLAVQRLYVDMEQTFDDYKLISGDILVLEQVEHNPPAPKYVYGRRAANSFYRCKEYFQILQKTITMNVQESVFSYSYRVPRHLQDVIGELKKKFDKKWRKEQRKKKKLAKIRKMNQSIDTEYNWDEITETEEQAFRRYLRENLSDLELDLSDLRVNCSGIQRFDFKIDISLLQSIDDLKERIGEKCNVPKSRIRLLSHNSFDEFERDIKEEEEVHALEYGFDYNRLNDTILRQPNEQINKLFKTFAGYSTVKRKYSVDFEILPEDEVFPKGTCFMWCSRANPTFGQYANEVFSHSMALPIQDEMPMVDFVNVLSAGFDIPAEKLFLMSEEGVVVGPQLLLSGAMTLGDISHYIVTQISVGHVDEITPPQFKTEEYAEAEFQCVRACAMWDRQIRSTTYMGTSAYYPRTNFYAIRVPSDITFGDVNDMRHDFITAVDGACEDRPELETYYCQEKNSFITSALMITEKNYSITVKRASKSVSGLIFGFKLVAPDEDTIVKFNKLLPNDRTSSYSFKHEETALKINN